MTSGKQTKRGVKLHATRFGSNTCVDGNDEAIERDSRCAGRASTYAVMGSSISFSFSTVKIVP